MEEQKYQKHPIVPLKTRRQISLNFTLVLPLYCVYLFFLCLINKTFNKTLFPIKLKLLAMNLFLTSFFPTKA